MCGMTALPSHHGERRDMCGDSNTHNCGCYEHVSWLGISWMELSCSHHEEVLGYLHVTSDHTTVAGPGAASSDAARRPPGLTTTRKLFMVHCSSWQAGPLVPAALHHL